MWLLAFYFLPFVFCFLALLYQLFTFTLTMTSGDYSIGNADLNRHLKEWSLTNHLGDNRYFIGFRLPTNVLSTEVDCRFGSYWWERILSCHMFILRINQLIFSRSFARSTFQHFFQIANIYDPAWGGSVKSIYVVLLCFTSPLMVFPCFYNYVA